MANVIIEAGLIIGMFFRPQPHLPGFEEIADDDPRIQEFINQTQEQK